MPRGALASLHQQPPHRPSPTSIDSLASTILSTAGTINTSATTIGGTATDINNTAGTINTTAGSIDDIAGGINARSRARSTAPPTSIRSIAGPGSGILGIARIIDTDAATIVRGLTETLGIAKGIKSDSGDILGDSDTIKDTAACIDVNANLGSPKRSQGRLPGQAAMSRAMSEQHRDAISRRTPCSVA